MFWKAASDFGERGFRKAVSCSQRAEWWIQTEGSVLPSMNGNVVSEGRGWQHVFGVGGGDMKLDMLISQVISSSIGDGMNLKCGVFFSDEGMMHLM